MTLPQPHNKISSNAFLAIQWTGFSLAFILLVFRLAVGWRTFRTFSLDDSLLIFSSICFLVNCVLWNVELPKTYHMSQAFAPHGPPNRAVKESVFFLRSLIAFNILFICCLWSVKLSFLAFFWKLGKGSQGRHYWLWVVTFVTLGTFAAAIGDYGWGCSRGSDSELLRYCATAKAKKDQSTTFRVNTAFDLLTDCLILSIPIIMVWRLHLPWAKKMALFTLFSLTIITMIVALIRLLVVPKRKLGSDLTWSFTWSNIEMAISLMVASLGAFRQLYVVKTRNDRHRDGQYQSSRPSKLKISFISRPKLQNPDTSQEQVEALDPPEPLHDVKKCMPKAEEEEPPFSLQTIQVPGYRFFCDFSG